MSQSKLQVYTQEATPILESYFNTLLGQEITFKLGEAIEATVDQIKSDAATFFSVVGTLENNESFVVQLDAAWIPIISSAMVGREMTPDEEGVFDLAGQIISQSYAALQKEHAQSAAFPTMNVAAHAPAAWEPEETFSAELWCIPVEMEVEGKALKGNVHIPQRWAEYIEAQAETPVESASAPEEEPVDVSTPKFPDFGRESLQQDGPGNFDLLAEVELNVSVELGRRKIPLSEVLKLTTGSVIELEKLVGEPLEIFANGRLIAEGEAVVIDEQFGIRITNLATNKLGAKAFA